MGFDSAYRREVLERWKQSSAQTKRLLLEALTPRPEVTLKERLRCALDVIKRHGKTPPDCVEDLLDDHDRTARVMGDAVADAPEKHGAHSAETAATDDY